MLESLVATILARYLGDYVEGLERENLRIGIMGGNVKLKNLRLKKEALADLKLPIQVKEGFLGSLELEVPWSSLGSSPAIARVDQVFLIAGPIQPSEYDPAIVRRKEIETKRRRLQVFSLMGDGAGDLMTDEERKAMEKEKENSQSSFTTRLIETIVDNFQLFIDNVHIRYEDNISNPQRPFVVGISIEHLHAQSTNEQWDPTFITGPHQFVHKLISLKNAAVYWNPKGDFLYYSTQQEMGATMSALIWKTDQITHPENNYLLSPISGTLKAVLNKTDTPDMHIPKVVVDIMFNQAKLSLGEYQYRDLMHLSNYFAYYIRGVKYHIYRPDPRIRPTQNSRLWWKFCIKSVTMDVREKREKWTWSYIKQRRLDREGYIALYKKKRTQAKLMTQQEIDTLNSFEDTLPLEDILLYRQLARASAKQDLLKAEEKKKKKAEEKKKMGWIGWGTSFVWGGKDDEEVMTKEQETEMWKQLYTAIGYSEDEEEKKLKKLAAVPAAYVKMRVNFKMNAASLSLRSSRPEDRAVPELLLAEMFSFNVIVSQRESSMSVSGGIKSVGVTEYHTLRDKQGTVQMVTVRENAVNTDFFSFQFDLKPLDGGADMRLALAGLQPVNVTFGRPIVDRMQEFFSHDADVSQLKLAAGNSYDVLKQQAEMQLKYALDNRKSVDIRIDILSPNIVIPKNFYDQDSPSLLLFLGKFSLRTDLESRKLAIQHSEGKEVSVSEDFFYDRFNLVLSGMNAIVSPNSRNALMGNSAEQLKVIKDFDIILNVAVCTVPSDELARLKVSGEMPAIALQLTPTSIGNLYQIAMAFVQKKKRLDQSGVLSSYERLEEKMLQEIQAERARREAYSKEKKSKESVQLQASFVIGKFSLSIGWIPEAQAQSKQYKDLLQIIVKGFDVQFQKSNYQMGAKLKLEAFQLIDMIQPYGESFRYIIGSFALAEENNPTANSLLSVEYTGIPDDSPIFGGVQHDFAMKFDSLDVMVNRGTILSANEFAQATLRLMKESELEESSELSETSSEMKKPGKDDAAIIPEKPETKSESKPITVLLKAALDVSRVSVTLQRSGKKYMYAALQDITVAGSIQSNNELQIDGSVGSIDLRDLSPNLSKWSRIVSIHGDRMVDFHFEMINADKENSNKRVIASVQVNTVRFVFLYCFVRSLLVYVKELQEIQKHVFARATSKISSRTQSQTELIKKRAISQATNESILILIDLTVANPHVVVPLSSTSKDYVVVNLGDIKIFNTIDKNSAGILIDTTTIEISSLGLKSVTHTAGETNQKAKKSVFSIIGNTDVKLTAKRPLNQDISQQDRLVPDVSASCNISAIAIAISPAAVNSAICLMKENMTELPYKPRDDNLLAEMQKNFFPSNSQLDTAENVSAEESLHLNPAVEFMALGEVEDHEIANQAKGQQEKITQKADIKQEKPITSKYSAELYLADISLELIQEDESPATERSFVKLSLEQLSSSFAMLDDSGMFAQAKIQRLTLVDTDPKSTNQFKTILGPKTEESSKITLLSVSYDKKSNGHQMAEVTLHAPRLLAIPKVIWGAKEYIQPKVGALLESLAVMQKGMANDGTSVDNLAVVAKSSEKEEKSRLESTSNPSTSSPLSLTASISIVDPALVLIEQPNIIGSRAIVMKTTLRANLSLHRDGNQNATVKIVDTQVYKCRLKNENATLVSILPPMNISIEYEMITNERQSISAEIDQSTILFSYQDFKTLLAIQKQFMDLMKKPEIAEPEIIPEKANAASTTLKLEPSSESISDIASSSDENLKKEAEDLVMVPKEQTIQKKELLSLATGGLDILLLNDMFEGGINMPVMRVAIKSFDCTLEDWSSSLHGSVVLADMHAGYYNSNLNCGEPLLEKWNLKAKVAKDRNCISLRLASSDALNVNVTYSFVTTVLDLIESWSADLSLEESSKRPFITPFKVRNNTGYPIEYWISGTNCKHRLEPGDEEPLELLEAEAQRRQGLRRKADEIDQTLSVQVLGEKFQQIHNLPINKVSYLVFEAKDKEEDETRLLYTVENKTGHKVLILGSDIVVENNTTIPLEIQVIVGQNIAKLPPLQGGEQRSLPLQVAWKGALRFRPAGSNYKWSRQQLPCRVIAPNNKPRYISCPEINQKPEEKEEQPGDLNVPRSYPTSWIYGFDVSGKRAQESGAYQAAQHIVLHFYTPLIIENCLGCALQFRVIEKLTNAVLKEDSVDAGQYCNVFQVVPRVAPFISIKVGNYDWSTPMELPQRHEERRLPLPSPQGPLELLADSKETSYGSFHIAIFCKFWIINRTQLKLIYKLHPDDEQIVPMQPVDVAHALNSQSSARIKNISNVEDLAIPFMFSGAHIVVKSEETEWSQKINLLTSSGVLELPQASRSGFSSGNSMIQLGVTVHSAPGKFWRTSVVQFYPKNILVNRLKEDLLIAQKGVDDDNTWKLLGSGTQICFDWSIASAPKFLQIRPAGQHSKDWKWSSPISLAAVDSFLIKIRNRFGDKMLVRVRVDNQEASTIVFFLSPKMDIPDYRILNETQFALSIGQVGVLDRETVSPGVSVDFTWDNLLEAEKKLDVRVLPTNAQGVYALDKLQKCNLITFELDGKGHTIQPEVQADGPTKIFIVKELHSHHGHDKPDMKLQDRKVQFDSATAPQFKDKEIVEARSTRRVVAADIVIHLDSVGISIIDETPQELLYLSLKDIQMEATTSNIDQTAELLVAHIQIDNQLYLSPYPVLLSGKPVEGKGFFHVAVTKSTRFTSILCIPYFAVCLQEMDVKVDEQCLLRLLKLAEVILSFIQKKQDIEKEKSLFITPSTFQIDESALERAQSSEMIYFQLLHINPIRVNLSFLIVGSATEADSEPSPLERILRAGGFLANIDNAPLRLNGLILEHPFCPKEELINRIVKHYTFQGMQEMYKILGSAEFLGSPVSLVNNLGTGVYDFFHEPAEGIVNSPTEFAKGLARGTSSLVKNTIYGVFNSASKLTGTISKAASTISMDSEWQQERARRVRNRPQHALAGVAHGVKDLGVGIFKGVTGVVSEPVKGAMQGGATGLIKGVGRGLTGVVLKPVVGVVDLVTDTAEGIKNTAVYFDAKVGRFRPPRFIPKTLNLVPFINESSVGQSILKELDSGKYMSEFYEYHTIIGENRMALISSERIFYLAGKNTKSLRNRWSAKFQDIQSVEITPEGIVIDMLGRMKIIPGRERDQKRMLIPIPEPAQASMVYKLMNVQLETRRSALDHFKRLHMEENKETVKKYEKGFVPLSKTSGAIIVQDDVPEESETSPLVMSQRNANGIGKDTRKKSEMKETSPLIPPLIPVKNVEEVGCCRSCCVIL